MYHGIDYDKNFLEKAESLFSQSKIKTVFHYGDCFNDLDLLPNKADLIIASHICYYAPNLFNFVEKLSLKLSGSGKMIFIHETSESQINILRDEFSLQSHKNLKNNVVSRIESNIKLINKQGKFIHNIDYFNFITKKTNADLSFSDEMLFDMKKLDDKFCKHKYEISDQHIGQHIEYEETQYLLEFIIQNKLEDLSVNSLCRYLDDIFKMLEVNDRKLNIQSAMQVINYENHEFYDLFHNTHYEVYH